MEKSAGTTPSEQYLASLCEKTFLGLWSYPNLFKDTGCRNGGDGNEICDLLVVCGKDVIIFSDKSRGYPNTGDINLDWSRWYKRAILKSFHQIYGAERWIKSYPDRIFVDSRCTTKFPLHLKIDADTRLQRIVVASGAKQACRSELGGTGSLWLLPEMSDNAHFDSSASAFRRFHIGTVNSRKGFIHVLDEVTLETLLGELDTVTDFVEYLDKKRRFIESEKLKLAEGEENLLAEYIVQRSNQSSYDFAQGEKTEKLVVKHGYWDKIRKTAGYRRKKEADKQSYVWDWLIQEFSDHILKGTILDPDGASISDHEVGMRILAREPRHHRRALAEAMLDRYRTAASDRASWRSVLSLQNPTVAFVFGFVPFDGGDYNLYQERRRNHLDAYCFVLGWKHKQLQRVVGIACEAQFGSEGGSHDIVVFEPTEWDPEAEN